MKEVDDMNKTTFVTSSAKQTNQIDVAIEVPNGETLEAIEEVNAMKKDHPIGKTYTDVDEMMKSLSD